MEKIRKLVGDKTFYKSRIFFSKAEGKNKFYEATNLKDKYNDYDFVIRYFEKDDLIFIFNLKHRKELKAEVSTISITGKDFLLEQVIGNGCYYKKIKGCLEKEKIIIIPTMLLDVVIDNLYEYFQINEFDEKDVYDEEEASLEIIERKRKSITRLVRDWRFQKNVISAYNGECAICRCNIIELLQAAHIIPVKDGGNDDVNNGICLCANHHLMFDRGLLSIDFNSLEVTIHNESIKVMPWFSEFKEKYKCKIKEKK